jgi:excisionase family DNA binding protein
MVPKKNTPVPTKDENSIYKFAAPPSEAASIGGFSRSELYEQIAAGNIRAVKLGRKTLVLLDSLRAFLEGLPSFHDDEHRVPSVRTLAKARNTTK